MARNRAREQLREDLMPEESVTEKLRLERQEKVDGFSLTLDLENEEEIDDLIGTEDEEQEEVAKKLGFPEARIPLAEVVVELALSPKSNTAYSAFDKAMEEIQDVKAQLFAEINEKVSPRI